MDTTRARGSLRRLHLAVVCRRRWALDLWHGRQTRPHEDLEIAIPRSRLAEARRTLADFEFWTASNGTLSSTPPTLDQHQSWVLDPIANVWRVDIFLEPGDDATWFYRRGFRVAEAFAVTADGIPYLRPELVFLFKAIAMRPKDDSSIRTTRGSELETLIGQRATGRPRSRA